MKALKALALLRFAKSNFPLNFPSKSYEKSQKNFIKISAFNSSISANYKFNKSAFKV